MRTFYFITIILINSIIFSQEDKIIGTPIPLNEIGIRLEIKNFFIDGHRFKIQEIKPYYKLNEKFKIGFGYCSLKDENFYFIDSTLPLPSLIKIGSIKSSILKLFSETSLLIQGESRTLRNLTFGNLPAIFMYISI